MKVNASEIAGAHLGATALALLPAMVVWSLDAGLLAASLVFLAAQSILLVQFLKHLRNPPDE